MKRTALQGILDNLAESLVGGSQGQVYSAMQKNGVQECRLDLLQPLQANDELQSELLPYFRHQQEWLFGELENRKINRDTLGSLDVKLSWRKGKLSVFWEARLKLRMTDGREMEAKRGSGNG